MMGIYWEMKREGLEEMQDECRPQWDGVTACVPSTIVNHMAILPCIEHYDGQYYDTKYNITKACLDNGTWDNYTNYTDCLDHPLNMEEGGVKEWEIFIFLLGYTVSIITLLVAIFIFLYFREMRCLRHKIHLNLFLSLLTANLDWVLSYGVQHFMVMFHDRDDTLSTLSTINCILHVLLRYFHLTNFFWMFVEGLYLFLQVQASFSVGSLKLRHCACIGWGVPLLLTLLWTLLVYCQAQTQVVTMNSKQGSQVRQQVNTSVLGCPFMTETKAEDQSLELLAYTVPVCAILVCNTVFLVWIMGVVISKLRPSDPHHQTQNVNLRAAKALIIIVPLLGITYLVTIVGPSEPDTTLETIFILTRNVLLSFQGFFITLPYCFLNGEVCTMMRNHWERWRNTKDIGQGPNSARNSIAMEGLNSVCDNLSRKRSRSYSYHVVRGALVDRRGTQESEMSNNTVKITKNSSPPPHDQGHLDGPLVPHPDLVQHSKVIDSDGVN